MRSKTQLLTLNGVIAAAYAALTLVASAMNLAYGPVQFRFSEALTVLPFLFPGTWPGLFVGCLVANLLSPYGPIDIVIGSLATLLAAIWTEKVDRPWLRCPPCCATWSWWAGCWLGMRSALPRSLLRCSPSTPCGSASVRRWSAMCWGCC